MRRRRTSAASDRWPRRRQIRDDLCANSSAMPKGLRTARSSRRPRAWCLTRHNWSRRARQRSKPSAPRWPVHSRTSGGRCGGRSALSKMPSPRGRRPARLALSLAHSHGKTSMRSRALSPSGSSGASRDRRDRAPSGRSCDPPGVGAITVGMWRRRQATAPSPATGAANRTPASAITASRRREEGRDVSGVRRRDPLSARSGEAASPKLSLVVATLPGATELDGEACCFGIARPCAEGAVDFVAGTAVTRRTPAGGGGVPGGRHPSAYQRRRRSPAGLPFAE